MTRYRRRCSEIKSSPTSSSASARARPRKELASSTSPRTMIRKSSLPSLPDPSRVVVPSSPRPVETGGLLSRSLTESPVLSGMHGQGSPGDPPAQAARDATSQLLPTLSAEPGSRTPRAPCGFTTKRNKPLAPLRPERRDPPSTAASNGSITIVALPRDSARFSTSPQAKPSRSTVAAHHAIPGGEQSCGDPRR